LAAHLQKDDQDDEGFNSEINMIPFIDIMLVLLIIFMVAAPMMNDMVEVDLPNAKSQAVKTEEKSVILSIRSDGKLFIDRTEIASKDLEKRLQFIFSAREKKEIFVNADENVKHGLIIQTMATIQRAGVSRIAFMTDPSQSQ
jgi:biopolymer transport protein TolR